MSRPYYLVLDQGTSATKVFLFDEHGTVRFRRRIKHRLLRPAPQHVECDPQSILAACRELIAAAVRFAVAEGNRIVRAGLAAQRSTFLFWDKTTTEPLTPALSWQDSRAQSETVPYQDRAEEIHRRTGIPLSAHFGAPKFRHLVRHDSALAQAVPAGTVWFGPLSAYLTHVLTGRAAVDESIAGRTLLMNLAQGTWDRELCEQFGVPCHCLPPLVPVTGDFGSVAVDGWEIPLACVVGDQQAALVGQGGLRPGTPAMNFGTSGSVQADTGTEPVLIDGLLSSVLLADGRERRFMLEGTINTGNSLFYWLETELGIPHADMRWYERCARTRTEGVLVPGFVGLAAPYWRDGFRTVWYRLDGASTDEIVRAGMESIGFLVYDIYRRILTKYRPQAALITASGGGAQPPLLQFIADLLELPVGHTTLKDRTALGVFHLLRRMEGERKEIPAAECDRIFRPEMDAETRRRKIARWHRVLDQAGIR
jgi:glycerol kinase